MVRWEQLARAGLAQYVIWVRQHTAPTQHVAPSLYRMLLEIDVPALTAHVRQLGEALIAACRCESFAAQLSHLARIIGVPECSVRLTALAAQWLLELGQYSDAARILEGLGNLDLIEDSLALVLASELFDLPRQKKTQYLTRAATVSLWEYERSLARLELVRHLWDCGDRDAARRQVGTIVTALREKMNEQPLLAEALGMQWMITHEESDYQAAMTALESCMDSERLMHFTAALAIDHGDFEEAEKRLEDAVANGDQVAQLLVVEARLRGNKLESGREMLRGITASAVSPHLAYPYAVTCAHVALACGDDQYRRDAMVRLRDLSLQGSTVTAHTIKLMQMLEARDIPPPRSPLRDWRGLFGRWH